MLKPEPSAADVNPPPRRVLELLTHHLTNSPLGVIEWDHEFRVSYWSGQAEAFFGWSPTEVMGKHPDDWRFVYEEDRASVARTMEELLKGEESRNISTNRNYTRDGRTLVCEWYNSVLTDEDGKLISVLSLVQDITERTTMEEQVRHLQRVRAIGQLTGGIAHDFNNLLTVILGYGEALSGVLADDPEHRLLAEEVMDAARRGAALTHQLLAFARQQPLQPRPVEISELLEGMRDLLTRLLGEEIDVQILAPAETWTAEVDPTQLESAVLNLCLNARDAMVGGGRLSIECENVRLDGRYAGSRLEFQEGDYVLITVSDTGTGMSTEIRDRVFEPFFTTKPQGKGTGLGLSMVYGFVRQSDGQVEIYSEEGEGTSVRIYLPREGDPADPDPMEVPELGSEFGEERILLVEDDSRVRSYAVMQLRALGYTVEAAGGGKEALALLAGGSPFDLLFTDVVLAGGMNGPELARRAQEAQPGIRVLFTSGFTWNARLALEPEPEAAQLFLPKPYQRANLARKIREALQAGEGQAGQSR